MNILEAKTTRKDKTKIQNMKERQRGTNIQIVLFKMATTFMN